MPCGGGRVSHGVAQRPASNVTPRATTPTRHHSRRGGQSWCASGNGVARAESTGEGGTRNQTPRRSGGLAAWIRPQSGRSKDEDGPDRRHRRHRAGHYESVFCVHGPLSRADGSGCRSAGALGRHRGTSPRRRCGQRRCSLTMSTDLSSFRQGGCIESSRPWARCRPCSCSVQCEGIPPCSSGAPQRCTRHSPIWQPTGIAPSPFSEVRLGSWAATERRAAVQKAGLSLGLDVAVVNAAAPTFEAATEAVGQILKLDVTAVIAFNDQMALGVMAGLARRGVGCARGRQRHRLR